MGVAAYIGVNSELYDNAYASSMYEGTMEILGDPFWSFDGMMQPCTYPIKLNVVMPKNDFTNKRSDYNFIESKKEQIELVIKELCKIGLDKGYNYHQLQVLYNQFRTYQLVRQHYSPIRFQQH